MITSSRLAALVPLKLNSRRLPNKNFLDFFGKPLCWHIFNILSQIPELDIYCYCSNAEVMNLLPRTIRYLPRKPYYDGDNIMAKELFTSAIEKLKSYEHILITHATSPLLEVSTLSKAIDFYFSNNEYDAVVSSLEFFKYAWHKNKTINYNPFEAKQTNQLSPIYIETSGFYIFNRESFIESGSRTGVNPYFWPISYDQSIDIDNEKEYVEALNIDQQRHSIQNNPYFPSPSSNHTLVLQALRPKLVIFDFDGVLIDSRSCMESSWEDVCNHFQLNIRFSEFLKCVGQPFPDILSRLNVNPSIRTELESLYFSKCRDYSSLVTIYDDILESLALLSHSGVLLALNTSKSKLNTMNLLNIYFSSINFSFICTPDVIPSKRGKPAPDSLAYTIANIGIDPADVCFVGDMNVDAECARRANIKYFHAAWGYGEFIENNSIWFENIIDLSTYLARLPV